LMVMFTLYFLSFLQILTRYCLLNAARLWLSFFPRLVLLFFSCPSSSSSLLFSTAMYTLHTHLHKINYSQSRREEQNQKSNHLLTASPSRAGRAFGLSQLEYGRGSALDGKSTGRNQLHRPAQVPSE
jgi:hypothetical protein